MAIRPLGKNIVLQLEEQKEQKVGGIYIPDTAKEKPQIAKVTAVGCSKKAEKAVKIGDRVLFAKYSGTEIELDGLKYVIVSVRDILAVVE